MDPIRMLIAAVPAVLAALAIQLLLRPARPAGVRMVEEARRAGRTARGTLVKRTYLRPYGEDETARNREGRLALVYAYEVDGREYLFRMTVEGSAPETLTLYYPKGRPGDAIPEMAAAHRPGAGYMLRVLLPVALWALFYHLLGAVL